MKKLLLVYFLITFFTVVSMAEILQDGNADVSTLRVSLLGGMFEGEGKSIIYSAFPANITKVIGLDLGIIGTKINTVYGLQAGLVSISNVSAGMQISPAFSQADIINGIQLSGFTSFARKRTAGIQAGGLAAVTVGGNFNGVQLSGIGSVNDVQFNGIQGSCVISYSEKMNGLQFAGLISKINNNLNGIQLAILWAYAERGNGIQAGVFGGGTLNGLSLVGWRVNSVQKYESCGIVISAVSLGKNFSADAYTVNGLQISGVNLFTGKTKGVQAGVINITEKVTGVQIGAFNYAAELEGMQIGLVNIARNAKIPVLPVVNFKF